MKTENIKNVEKETVCVLLLAGYASIQYYLDS